MRGENGSRFVPRTVPWYNSKQQPHASEAVYSPRVIEVHLVYEALFSYDFHLIAAIAGKGRAIRTITIVVILAAHAENSLISSAILAVNYPTVEELFIYNNCDCLSIAVIVSDFSDCIAIAVIAAIFPVMSTPSVKICRNKFRVVIQSNKNNHPFHRSSIFFFCSFHSFSCSICILSSKDTCSRINEVRTCVSL